ncbi:MAG: hypothetical protein AAGC74_14010 [Verrucomicrobiota bacterium]
MQRFLIDLTQLPEDGKSFAGELDPGIFALGERDPKPLAPITFDLFAQRFESELLLQGTLSCPFEFECVRTLRLFTKTLFLPSAAISLEIGSKTEIDASDALREEILLEIPNYPTCDIADEPQNSEIDPRYLAVDNGDQNEVDTPPPAEGDSRWSALDSLKTGEN